MASIKSMNASMNFTFIQFNAKRNSDVQPRLDLENKRHIRMQWHDLFEQWVVYRYNGNRNWNTTCLLSNSSQWWISRCDHFNSWYWLWRKRTVIFLTSSSLYQGCTSPTLWNTVFVSPHNWLVHKLNLYKEAFLGHLSSPLSWLTLWLDIHYSNVLKESIITL